MATWTTTLITQIQSELYPMLIRMQVEYPYSSYGTLSLKDKNNGTGIFLSKDRREEVIEVEEEPEFFFNPELKEMIKLMTQGQWMKGCPEGGEQGFLFSLYSQLCDGSCPCPVECGASVPREKHHFFSVYVSGNEL
jgi:hypothetical protein